MPTTPTPTPSPNTLVFAELDELFVVASVYRGGRPGLARPALRPGPAACTPVVELSHVDGGLDAAARARWSSGCARRRSVTACALTRDVRVASGEQGGGGHRRCRWCRDPRCWAAAARS
ncbi:MAG: hypothetical protein HS111_22380 [Kofleriaceae bacterium]|nr:hypothetical protein [Kofleriaceae bacterium]